MHDPLTGPGVADGPFPPDHGSLRSPSRSSGSSTGRARARWSRLHTVLAGTAVATLAAGGVVSAALVSGAATRSTAAVTEGVYTLRSAATGKCAEVPDGSTAPGALLQQLACATGAPRQQFVLTSTGDGAFQLKNVASGLCVDVPGAATAAGTRVQQWGCSSGAAWQSWTVTGDATNGYQLTSGASRLCLAVDGGSTAGGAAIVQTTCTDRTTWRLTEVGSASASTSASATGTTTAPSTPSSAAPVVAADGSGSYTTVQAAIDAVPTGNASRRTITIAPGTYRGKITIPSTKPYLTLKGLGSSPSAVVLVANRSSGAYGLQGSATLQSDAHDVVATNLTISNDLDESTVTSGAQALALAVGGDRTVLENVRLLGDQDTFYVATGTRTYVHASYVEGTVDFVFGGGTLVLDDSTIHEKRTSGGPVTAASTESATTYGILIYRSKITGNGAGTVHLGRPWRQGAQVLVRESTLSADVAKAKPWTDMSSNTWQAARFFEYLNTGPGATVNSNRPQLPAGQASTYTPAKYLAGTDGWAPVVTTTTPTTTSTTTAATTSAAATSTSTSSSATTPGAARTWSSTADGFASTDGGTTGGAGGATVTVTTQADLQKYAAASTPYVIKVAATIKVTPYGYEIPISSNKTVIGVGTAGQLVNGGLHLNPGTKNVIIRNLTIRDAQMSEDDPDDKTYDYDGIQMDTADHVWIDHNRIVRMNDGLIDSRKDTSHLTVSWNEIGYENKAFGIGWTPNVTARITIHHNWIHDNKQRNPSVDNVAYAHLYNNWMQNITSYGNAARGSTKLVLENSYFENVANPYYNETDTASLTQRGSVLVNCTGKQQTHGTTFDPSGFYSYTLDAAKDVPALLTKYTGPQANIGI